ncbi:MAG: hypothetical protein IIA41_09310 [SAR324 cluster bacterium]|nr:hypothetical protein [SAR324 cluster bacterium]
MTEVTPQAEPRAGGGDQPVALRKLRAETRFIHETRGLERQERDRYSSMLWNLMRLDLAPKVKIIDIVGTQLDSAIGTEDERSIARVVDHYHNRPTHAELNQVLKFFSAFLMQRARREPSFSGQQFLLFKAVDLLRMLTQYSTWAAHPDSESLVYVIFDAMGTGHPDRFGNYRETELTVYPLMKRLHDAPRDFNIRLRLGDELSKQTSFFDALVQYDFLRRFYPRFYRDRHLDQRLTVIYSRVAGLFQNMLDHLGRGYRDARKLNSFIDRYNRHFASRKEAIVPITDASRAAGGKTARGLRQAAERWYRRALAIKVGPPHLQTENAAKLGKNLLGERRLREALAVMTDGYRYWRGLPEEPEYLRRRVEYLQQLFDIGVRMGRRDQVAWANEEQREHGGRLEEMVRAQSEYTRRREQILLDARDEEPDEV